MELNTVRSNNASWIDICLGPILGLWRAATAGLALNPLLVKALLEFYSRGIYIFGVYFSLASETKFKKN